MATVCLSALEAVITRSEVESATLEDMAAKTPGGQASYKRTAPPTWFGWAKGGRILTASTSQHGPAEVLMVSGRTPAVGLSARKADRRSVANPEKIAPAYVALEVGLRRLGKVANRVGCAGQEHLLWELLNDVAHLLLDPDTEARQQRAERYLDAEKRRRARDRRLSVKAFRGGAPGLGKRS